ncbi:MAG: cysteine desulfurase family protein [Acidimicrobiales bacterium]
MARHFLDHASTSIPRESARSAFTEALRLQEFSSIADPGRIHHEGMTTRALLEQARAQVADLLGAKQREIVFTSGATESIATATWGAVRRGVDAGHRPHVVYSAVEHSAVRGSSELFAHSLGGSVSVVGVDDEGRIDIDAFLSSLAPNTVLAHVQWGNHEVGTLQPIQEITNACHERGILVHVDAAQAVGHVPTTPKELGIDLLSFSGHKFGGPSGIGGLWIRQGLRIEPLLPGGEQERARRAGLENVPAAIALGAAAAELDQSTLDIEASAARVLIAAAIERLTAIDGVSLLGPSRAGARLPHIACFAVEGVEPQGVVLGLDQRGISLHSGSSCASEGLEPSPILEAMGVDAHRSLRVSVGYNSTMSDIDALCEHLPVVLRELRSLHT